MPCRTPSLDPLDNNASDNQKNNHQSNRPNNVKNQPECALKEKHINCQVNFTIFIFK